MKTYTLYWLDGTREVIKGKDIATAFMIAGYGGGTLRALDFTCKGEDKSYSWDGKKWNKKEEEK